VELNKKQFEKIRELLLRPIDVNPLKTLSYGGGFMDNYDRTLIIKGKIEFFTLEQLIKEINKISKES